MSSKALRVRELRYDGSRAERICWELVRAHRVQGLKFRRQHPIGPYFADFACPSRKLIIEIDGDFHADQAEEDMRRTAMMEREGSRVVRLAAAEVVQNPEGIWASIDALLSESSRPPLSTSPPSGGEEHK